MRIGLALPQYDYSVAGESPLRWETVAEYARTAARSGFHSLWLSDHLFLDLAKYGGPPARAEAFDPIVTLAALAGVVSGPRLGTLVMCEALRPASVLAKSLASLDVACGGRLDVGVGAGWYAPEYEAIGMALPAPGVRLARLRETILVLRALLGGGPATFAGEYQSVAGAVNQPPALQSSRPPIMVGGRGDRLLRLVAELADGWNTCWAYTPDEYAARLTVLDQACAEVGRDPATVTRSLGLYALAGEGPADLDRRYRRLVDVTPPGVLDDVPLAEWRRGRLVGTVAEVREQRDRWADLGVDELIVGVGAVPFAVTGLDDVELLGAALGG
jgi:probable F420-dependent oxidoreductase